jgi:DNA-binding NarL/FixJ family response regulator
MVADGMARRLSTFADEVAVELGLSARTVEHHKYDAIDVLGLNSTAMRSSPRPS